MPVKALELSFKVRVQQPQTCPQTTPEGSSEGPMCRGNFLPFPKLCPFLTPKLLHREWDGIGDALRGIWVPSGIGALRGIGARRCLGVLSKALGWS